MKESAADGEKERHTEKSELGTCEVAIAPDQPSNNEIANVRPCVRRLPDDMADLFFTEREGIFLELRPRTVYHVPVFGMEAHGSAGGRVPSCKISTD